MSTTSHIKSVAFTIPEGADLATGDVVVIGAGLAGLFTALKLAPIPVTVVAARPLGEGAASSWAQGGVAAAVGEGDTPEAHAEDTIAAGAGLVDPAVAKVVTEEAPERIRDLLRYGIPFDRDLAGHFVLSREAAHSEKRIIRVSGDRAGAAIMQALITAVRATPSIRLLEGYEAEDLIVEADRVTGVRLIEGSARGHGAFDLLPARAVVVATGGIGSLYAVTTNPDTSRGEALAFGARAGAVVADCEFVQFHPTAINVGAAPAPLATEALRGEGAVLINNLGQQFMKELHADAELAPRDIVARGVAAEITAGHQVFLDCRRAVGSRMPSAFPTVTAHCRAAGIDPVHERIPVTPAAHYHMGGLATDLRGRTNVKGLWAVGEVASTGLHGANRLASNSLLEAVVFGHRAANDIRNLTPDGIKQPLAKLKRIVGVERADHVLRATAIARLRRIMRDNVGVVRTGDGLVEALATLAQIERDAGNDSVLANMALAASFIAGAALMRDENRGAHFRSDCDFGAADPKRSFMTLADLEALRRRILDDGLQRRTGTTGHLA